MALMYVALIASALLGLYPHVQAEYIPPGPLYRCPKEKLLLHPCTCDTESDKGLWISCNNTNIASMSLALNNLATFELPIETLTIKSCHIGKQTICWYRFWVTRNTLNRLNGRMWLLAKIQTLCIIWNLPENLK